MGSVGFKAPENKLGENVRLAARGEAVWAEATWLNPHNFTRHVKIDLADSASNVRPW
jgi:hypothetical protein